MKIAKVKHLHWWNFGWGAWLVIYGVFRFVVMRQHWSHGLWIVAGVVFIIAGIYWWKVAKNAN